MHAGVENENGLANVCIVGIFDWLFYGFCLQCLANVALPCLGGQFEASYFKMTRIQPCLTLHGHSGWRQKGGDNPHYVNPIQLMDFRVSIKFKPNPLESHFPLLLSYLLPTLGRKCMIIVKEIKVHLSLRTVKNRLTL